MAQQTIQRGLSRASGSPSGSPVASPVPPRRGAHSRWCGWSPWGGSGRELVQICCKEGYSAGSWRRSPAWTTCVPLDHLNAVGPPGSRNTVVQRNASGPTARKWSKRAGRVTTCETPSHHAGRAVRAERGRGAPEPPLPRPVRPRRPARRSRRARLPPARPEATRAGHHDRPRAPAPLTTPRITPGESALRTTPRTALTISPPGNTTGRPPNNLQRRPGPGSAARRSAEYQRLSSRAPA